MVSLKFSGGITGTMWMPSCQGGIDVADDLDSRRSRMCGPGRVTLRGLMLHLIMERGGDFQNSMFTADSEIEVCSLKNGRRRYRSWPITAFLSIADMVAEDVYMCDFYFEED